MEPVIAERPQDLHQVLLRSPSKDLANDPRAGGRQEFGCSTEHVGLGGLRVHLEDRRLDAPAGAVVVEALQGHVDGAGRLAKPGPQRVRAVR